MMPIPLAPEADKVLDLLAGLVASPEGFHSLVLSAWRVIGLRSLPLRAVLDAHTRAERGEPDMVGRVSPRPALH
jgi:hypothetical protein